MPSEKQIREAIAAVIEAAAPSAVVLPRNILNVMDDGWLGLLQSASDANRVRGWLVSRKEDVPHEDRLRGVEYNTGFHVWCCHGYFTGNNTSNSEDIFSAEIDAVKLAFADRMALATILQAASPLSFPVVNVFPVGESRKLVHIAQGSITVPNVTGC